MYILCLSGELFLFRFISFISLIIFHFSRNWFNCFMLNKVGRRVDQNFIVRSILKYIREKLESFYFVVFFVGGGW